MRLMVSHLRYKVLEVNAGSNRCGKSLLGLLHEATQSQQIAGTAKAEEKVPPVEVTAPTKREKVPKAAPVNMPASAATAAFFAPKPVKAGKLGAKAEPKATGAPSKAKAGAAAGSLFASAGGSKKRKAVAPVSYSSCCFVIALGSRPMERGVAACCPLTDFWFLPRVPGHQRRLFEF